MHQILYCLSSRETCGRGIPGNTSLVDRRYYCVAHILTSGPQDPELPRSKLYSNAGYMAAGLMLEKVTNKTWEELIQKMSDELGLGIHIGWPVEFGLLTSPSGNISITVTGFLEYARLILSGLKGNDNYLRTSTYQTILKTYPDYSLGWWVEGEGEKTLYGHRGSNGAFCAFACHTLCRQGKSCAALRRLISTVICIFFITHL